MKKQTLFLAILVALAVAVVSSPSVEANCIPNKTMGTNSGGYYAYLVFGDTSGNPNNFEGGFWQTGNKAGVNGDACAKSFWVYHAGGYYWGVGPGTIPRGVPLSDTCVGPGSACPGGNVTVFMDNCVSDEFLLITVPEAFVNGFDFSQAYYLYNAGIYINAGPSPRPRVTSSARNVNDITVNYTVNDVTSGVQNFSGVGQGNVTGVNVYTRSGATQPSLDSTAGWTLQDSLAATGGSDSVVVDCSNTTVDQFVAAGLVLGSGDIALGCPVRVECDPNLVEPPDLNPKKKLPGLKGSKKNR